MPTIAQELAEKREQLAELFKKATLPDGTYNLASAELQEVRKRNEELGDLQKKYDELVALEKIRKQNEEILGQIGEVRRPVFGESAPERKDAAAQPVSSGKAIYDAVMKMRSAGINHGVMELPEAIFAKAGGPDIEFKSMFLTTSGWEPEVIRSGKVVLSAQEELRVVDLYPKGTTTQAGYKYMKETTFTNGAANVAEGAAIPEGTLKLTETTQNVEKIGVSIPVTDEQLEDVANAQAYITRRLEFMVGQTLETQLLSGTGAAPQLLGTLNLTSIQTQAKGTDPNVDAVMKAMTKIRVTGKTTPNAILMHPNDWQEVRLLRTAVGDYIFGDPSLQVSSMLWGLPVALSTYITEGTSLVGDFANFSELFFRRGITVQMTNSHDTDFLLDVQRIKVTMRCVLVHFRDEAFCKVTGI